MKQDSKGRLLKVFSVVALAVVVIAPAAASWHGLVAAGRDLFGLTDGWEYVVPLTLDGAALYSGTLAIRAVLHGDSAFGARALTALYAMAAAGFNGYHALHTPGGQIPAAMFFAGASVSAVVLWDVTLRALRRDQLREMGVIEPPLPRWRLLRWLVAPISTGRAWRLAVIEQISDPSDALKLAAARKAEREAERKALEHERKVRTAIAERVKETPALATGANDEGGTDEQGDVAGTEEQRPAGEARELPGDRGAAGDGREAPAGVGGHGGEGVGPTDVDGRVAGGVPALDQLTEQQSEFTEAAHWDFAPKLRKASNKKAAMQAAFDWLGRKDVLAALELLKRHGVEIDRSYAYTIPWNPPLRAVGNDQ